MLQRSIPPYLRAQLPPTARAPAIGLAHCLTHSRWESLAKYQRPRRRLEMGPWPHDPAHGQSRKKFTAASDDALVRMAEYLVVSSHPRIGLEGKLDMEGGALWRASLRNQASTVPLDDLATQQETDAGTLRFCCEERVE
jgi:hypothetical protein